MTASDFFRKTLIIGENPPTFGSELPFRYRYTLKDGREGGLIHTTRILLEMIYGKSSPEEYERFLSDYDLANSSNIASNSFNAANAVLYLDRHLNDLEDYTERVSKGRSIVPFTEDQDLPLFARRMVVFFGKVGSLFDQLYLQRGEQNQHFMEDKKRSYAAYLKVADVAYQKLEVISLLVAVHHPSFMLTKHKRDTRSYLDI
ncbi:hypothetical protein GGE65_008289 [Skermanella aerolata]|uniref:hypothetical protein n=1 Tax=Skermanella aerolata TaxID=393310 RepID=UPI003D232706